MSLKRLRQELSSVTFLIFHSILRRTKGFESCFLANDFSSSELNSESDIVFNSDRFDSIKTNQQILRGLDEKEIETLSSAKSQNKLSLVIFDPVQIFKRKVKKLLELQVC